MLKNGMQCYQNPQFTNLSTVHIWSVNSKRFQIFQHKIHPSMLHWSIDITESGNNVFLHEWSCWNAEIIACNVTRSHNLLTFLQYTRAVICKKIQIFHHVFNPSLLNSSLNITEWGNNVFLHNRSCWNTKIMECNVSRINNLLTVLPHLYEMWFRKIFRYFITISTQVYLTHI